jgi:hypothetical protein
VFDVAVEPSAAEKKVISVALELADEDAALPSPLKRVRL